ncbi:MAG: NnrS family protein [Myxococcaceae bacterium]
MTPTAPSAPEWRREPYRLLFPLGALLGRWGTAPWLLAALGVEGQYRTLFHSVTQFQAFLTCFALGFLFTFVPRRTGTAAPATWQMLVAMLAPVAIAVGAWVEAWAFTQLVWLGLLAMLVGFVIVRLVSAADTRNPPGAFAWIPLGIFSGAAGALLLLRSSAAGRGSAILHGLGMGLVTQGLFLSLVLGVGTMLIPMLLYGPAPGRAQRPLFGAGGAIHIVLGLALLASFVLEWVVELRLGWALRALIVAGVLAFVARVARPPTVPGLHRRFVWLSAWMLPLGYALGAIWPMHRVAAEHVVFLGLALMTLSVATHVVLSHSGRGEVLGRRPWQVGALGVSVLVALALRLLVSLDPARFMLWLGAAAASFLVAVLVWIGWLGRPTGARPA